LESTWRAIAEVLQEGFVCGCRHRLRREGGYLEKELAKAGQRSAALTAERGVDVTTTIAASPLTVADRCDRCGAQAYVRATMESGFDLLLCAHHFHENESRLREIAVSIQDESERLVQVPATAALEER
jgi:hypothetical protein